MRMWSWIDRWPRTYMPKGSRRWLPQALMLWMRTSDHGWRRHDGLFHLNLVYSKTPIQ